MISTFVSRTQAPPKPETIAKIAGVISVSPLITLSHPPLGIIRTAGGLLGKVLPNATVAAVVPEEV